MKRTLSVFPVFLLLTSFATAQPLDDVRLIGIVRGHDGVDTTTLSATTVIIENLYSGYRDSTVTDATGHWMWIGLGIRAESPASLPSDIALSPSYPNPFSETTTIRIQNHRLQNVRLDVYNILGQRVAELMDDRLSPGTFELSWNGVNRSGQALAQGMYFLCLKAGEKSFTQKIVVLGTGTGTSNLSFRMINPNTGIEQAVADARRRTLDDFSLRLEFRHAGYDTVITALTVPDGRDTLLITYMQSRDPSSAGMVLVPAGFYSMGNGTYTGSSPVHTVNHPAFYMDIFEVTNAAYKIFCDSTHRAYPQDPAFTGMSNYFTNPLYALYPVVMVSWDDTRAYAAWAGKRLPSEVEWERAAKGDADNRSWPWGNTWIAGNSNSSVSGDGYAYTSPVGAFPGGVSPAGCHDMAGNVWEYCEDDWHNNYYSAPVDGRAWVENPRNQARPVRGGSWNAAENFVTCAYRESSNLNTPTNRKGFRCARTVINAAPDVPRIPNPADQAINQPVTTDVWWTSQDPNGDSLMFNVYFGTTSPPPLAASGIASMHYDPGILLDSTTYYWRIDAYDNHDSSATSPTWTFRTLGQIVDGMVFVPTGSFTMGSTQMGGAAIPEHTVNVPAFYMDIYEVTNVQYRAFCDATGHAYPTDDASDFHTPPYFTNPTYANYPVVMVSWYDAQAYATWAGKRLPTEAEWERAAKGTTDNRRWPWGDTWIGTNANIYNNPEDGYQWTAPVGHYPGGISPAGCYDMVGNLWEWIEDDYHSNYTGAPTDGSAWMDTPRTNNRIVRSGSWWRDNTYCNTLYRFPNPPGTPGSGIGIRCARTP